ncbi:lysophospholipid acyltransferase family protein [Acinetobacter sp. MD2]|uniref:lysophospholipid acyltransferase family protein n=1 Tax=Acinetobacter sp. MD2 TaxID=2600066 RepID=UPI002D1EC846|nr:lysophospholipid acyltransferase family protein [Acinetobacter sp. MD2]MEB3766251.1 lysophospholipid acyltransferase family protein [Acinetobacter sp. MD2]
MIMANSQSFTYHALKFISKQPLHFARSMAGFLASITYKLHLSKTADAAERNIQIALPELSSVQQQRIIKQAIQNEMMSYFEFFNVWGASNKKNIARIHKIYGEQIFHDALAEGKGLVLIVPHFGTWEAMNAWFAAHTAMTIMYKPIKNSAADTFVREARSRENATLVPTDESGVREVFKSLKRGGTTVILPDHSPNVGGTMVDYFGIPLASSNLSAKLIQKTKARALFLYAMRNDNAGYDMHIEAIDEQIYQGSDVEGTRIIHHMIENLIRQYPEHYHWSYKRFKANPELDDVYHLSTEDALKKVAQVRKQALTKAD